MSVRANKFDSALIEAGPAPVLLASGNLFFVYNSARKIGPTVKPGYDFEYNCGWAILNGSDPSQVLQRGDEPLLSPATDWEFGNGTKKGENLDLTPNVVFCEGIEVLQSNQFRVFYGAADAVIGAFLVYVKETN
jgi:predicted GH43/DUF377 family glycosyl hydrolase